MHSLAAHSEPVLSIDISSDGKILASGSQDKTVRVWSLSSFTEIKSLLGHRDTVSAVVFSHATNTLFSGSHDSTIIVWNLETFTIIKTLSDHNYKKILALSYNKYNESIASGGADSKIIIWDAARLESRFTLDTNNNCSINSLVFSPDGLRLASALNSVQEKLIHIWDLDTRQPTNTYSKDLAVINCISFSPDGNILAAGGTDQLISLWNPNIPNI